MKVSHFIKPNRMSITKHPLLPHIHRIRKSFRSEKEGYVTRTDEAVQEYLHYFGLDFFGVSIRSGFIHSNGKRIAGKIFLPENIRGSIICVHGYLDHSGTFTRFIRACLSRGFAAGLFDLPGHGLSEGRRAFIDDFGSYKAVLCDYIRSVEKWLPPPIHLVGHSTGAAILIDGLLTDTFRSLPFSKIVFVAPLVRSANWIGSIIGHALGKKMIRKIPAGTPDNSSDPGFISFLKNDPLRCSHIDFEWFEALRRWKKQMEQCEKSDKKLLILQGTGDRTVDWKYNKRFLEQKFPNAAFRMFPDGKHHLLNEKAEIRNAVIQDVLDYLEKPNRYHPAKKQSESGISP